MKQFSILLRQPVYCLSLLILSSVLLVALAGNFYTPYNPLALDINARLNPPSASHWLGTDHFGRDLLSRLMSGATVSIRVSLLTVGIALLFGTVAGAFSGFYGGWLDRAIMAVADAFLAMPAILLALILTVVIGPGEFGVITALGMAYTPYFIRVVRSTVLSIRTREFIEVSHVMGNGSLYTIFRHVIPNALGPLIITGSAFFAHSLLSESALSFLGLGVPPPHPTWGGILADSRQYIMEAPWLCIFPGLAIAITLLGVNLFGDALRDVFDPRSGYRVEPQNVEEQKA